MVFVAKEREIRNEKGRKRGKRRREEKALKRKEFSKNKQLITF